MPIFFASRRNSCIFAVAVYDPARRTAAATGAFSAEGTPGSNPRRGAGVVELARLESE